MKNTEKSKSALILIVIILCVLSMGIRGFTCRRLVRKHWKYYSYNINRIELEFAIINETYTDYNALSMSEGQWLYKNKPLPAYLTVLPKPDKLNFLTNYTETDRTYYVVYKENRDGPKVVQDTGIANTKVIPDETSGGYRVWVKLKRDSTRAKMASLTSENVQAHCAVIMNYQIQSIIQITERIDKELFIPGIFTEDEAKYIASMLMVRQ